MGRLQKMLQLDRVNWRKNLGLVGKKEKSRHNCYVERERKGRYEKVRYIYGGVEVCEDKNNTNVIIKKNNEINILISGTRS